MPADQDSSDNKLLDVDQPQGWATAFPIARQSISIAPPPIPTTSIQSNSVPTPGFLPDHAHAQDQDQGFTITQQSISTTPPPIPTATIQHNSMPLPPEAQYSSRDALFEAIQA